MTLSKEVLELVDRYQVVLNGDTIPLKELTHEEALRALVPMLDLLEELDDSTQKMMGLVQEIRYHGIIQNDELMDKIESQDL